MVLSLAFGFIAGSALGLWARVGGLLVAMVVFGVAITAILGHAWGWSPAMLAAGFALTSTAMQAGYLAVVVARFGLMGVPQAAPRGTQAHLH